MNTSKISSFTSLHVIGYLPYLLPYYCIVTWIILFIVDYFAFEHCFIVLSIMDETEYSSLVAFLNSPDSQRVWPETVSSKDKKRAFRRKAAQFQLISGTLHYTHTKFGNVRVIKASDTQTILHATHAAPTGGHLGVML